MLKGHGERDYSKFTIYSLCRDLIKNHNLDVKILTDFGSRHGESIDELADICKPETKFVLVEPIPKCCGIIRDKIKASRPDIDFRLIEAVVGQNAGSLQMHTFEKDDDQSANAFTNRSGIYGQDSLIEVPVIGYSIFGEMFPGQSIDFAKINVEGWEYNMMESGFFKHKINAFVMEVHNKHVPNRTWRNAVECLESDFDITLLGDLEHKYCFMTGVRCK